MVKITGSNQILQTSSDDENILTGQVLNYISLMNPDSDITLTINEGDPIFVPLGVGFSTADIKSLSKINKVIIKEDATNYFWHGYLIDTDSKV